MAITSVAYKPLWLCTGYNPIVWSVLSDNIGQADFSYVFDVYINGVNTVRIKQRPNPANYGMIDVSAIVEPYLNTSAFTQGLTESSLSDWFWDNEAASAHVYIKVGEQFGADGTIYNGTTDAVGAPAYAVYSSYSGLDVPVHAIAGSLDDHTNLWQMQDTSGGGIWSSNPFQGDRAYDHGLDLAYPLSWDTLERDMFSFDKGIITWINWSPWAAQQNRPIYGFRYKIYNAGGSLVKTVDTPVIVADGSGPRTVCSGSIAAQLDHEYDLIHVVCGPDEIKSLTATPAMGPGWSYTIQGYEVATLGSCTFGEPVTVEVKITISEYCEYLYPRARLNWLNSYGGRDGFNFTAEAEENISSTQSSYAQEQLNWSGSVPVTQLGSFYPPTATLAIKGGNKVYNKSIQTTWKLTTDWLTQDQITLLKDCAKSSQVLLYIKGESTIYDYFPYACTIKNATYSVKLIKAYKMYTVTFEVELAQPQKMQNN
jgi:hypothetical protein